MLHKTQNSASQSGEEILFTINFTWTPCDAKELLVPPSQLWINTRLFQVWFWCIWNHKAHSLVGDRRQPDRQHGLYVILIQKQISPA